MVTIEPQVFYGALGALIAAVAFWIRSQAQTRRAAQDAKSYADKQHSDGQLVIDKAQATVLTDIAEIAKAGVKTQEGVIAVVRENTKAFQENTKAFQENTTEFRNLSTSIYENTSAIRAAAVGMDETGAAVGVIQVSVSEIQSDVDKIEKVTATLETNLGETFKTSFKDQFGPVIATLTSIDEQITTLARELQSQDGRINQHFGELTLAFQDAKKQFLTILEPIVLKHVADFLPHDENGKEKDIS
jgi:hypothetical protein